MNLPYPKGFIGRIRWCAVRTSFIISTIPLASPSKISTIIRWQRPTPVLLLLLSAILILFCPFPVHSSVPRIALYTFTAHRLLDIVKLPSLYRDAISLKSLLVSPQKGQKFFLWKDCLFLFIRAVSDSGFKYQTFCKIRTTDSPARWYPLHGITALSSDSSHNAEWRSNLILTAVTLYHAISTVIKLQL